MGEFAWQAQFERRWGHRPLYTALEEPIRNKAESAWATASQKPPTIQRWFLLRRKALFAVSRNHPFAEHVDVDSLVDAFGTRSILPAMKRVAFYARVSTADGQSTENQIRALHDVAAHSGWNVVAIFRNDGVSGAKGRDRRPGLDGLLKAVTRREVDLVATWAVDHLGRSLPDLVALLGELQARGVDLFLHQQALTLAAFSQFQPQSIGALICEVIIKMSREMAHH